MWNDFTARDIYLPTMCQLLQSPIYICSRWTRLVMRQPVLPWRYWIQSGLSPRKNSSPGSVFLFSWHHRPLLFLQSQE